MQRGIVLSHAVEDGGEHKQILRIDETDRAQVAGVSPRAPRASCAVPRRREAIFLRVDHDAEPAIERVAEGLVAPTDRMARRDRFDCLRSDDAFTAREHRLIKPAEIVNGTAAVAARTLDRNRFSAVRPWRVWIEPRRFDGAAKMHRRDSITVFAPSICRHPDPRVAHSERLEDFLANVLAIRPAVSRYASHDFCEHVPS